MHYSGLTEMFWKSFTKSTLWGMVKTSSSSTPSSLPYLFWNRIIGKSNQKYFLLCITLDQLDLFGKALTNTKLWRMVRTSSSSPSSLPYVSFNRIIRNSTQSCLLLLLILLLLLLLRLFVEKIKKTKSQGIVKSAPNYVLLCIMNQ